MAVAVAHRGVIRSAGSIHPALQRGPRPDEGANPGHLLALRDVDVNFTSVLVARTDSGVNSPADVSGKRLALGSADSGQAAILPVHLYGQACELAPLKQIADKNGLILIEDTAQAHGAVYKGRRAGTIGLLRRRRG